MVPIYPTDYHHATLEARRLIEYLGWQPGPLPRHDLIILQHIAQLHSSKEANDNLIIKLVERLQAILSYLPLNSASSRSYSSTLATAPNPLSPYQIALPEESPSSCNSISCTLETRNTDEEHLVAASQTFQQFGNNQIIHEGRMPHLIATFRTGNSSMSMEAPHPKTLVRSPRPSPSHFLLSESNCVHFEEPQSPFSNSVTRENTRWNSNTSTEHEPVTASLEFSRFTSEGSHLSGQTPFFA